MQPHTAVDDSYSDSGSVPALRKSNIGIDGADDVIQRSVNPAIGRDEDNIGVIG